MVITRDFAEDFDFSFLDGSIKELELFEHYINSIENSIHENFKDCKDEDSFVIYDYFIQKKRYSDVISLVALLEKGLELACDELAVILREEILFKKDEINVKGSICNNRIKYISQYGKFDIKESEEVSESWKLISALIKIRNVIVHSDGVGTIYNINGIKGLSKIIAGITYKKQTDIDGKETGSIIEIDNSYIKMMINEVRKMFKYIIKNFQIIRRRIIKPEILK